MLDIYIDSIAFCLLVFTTFIPPRVPRLLEALSLINVYKSPMPPIHCSHPVFLSPNTFRYIHIFSVLPLISVYKCKTVAKWTVVIRNSVVLLVYKCKQSMDSMLLHASSSPCFRGFLIRIPHIGHSVCGGRFIRLSRSSTRSSSCTVCVSKRL